MATAENPEIGSVQFFDDQSERLIAVRRGYLDGDELLVIEVDGAEVLVVDWDDAAALRESLAKLMEG